MRKYIQNGGTDMANCPKCNAKLKLTDWRPECPKCGVNMVYYGMEERLLADAEKAEAEHAKFQKGLDRVKASSIKGKRQIARIVLSIIPILGLLLPLASISLKNIPFVEDKTISVNLITLITEYFMKLFDIDGLLAMVGHNAVGTPFILFAASIICLALSIVVGIFNFGRNFCSSQPKSCKKNMIVSIVSMLLAVASGITFAVFASGIVKLFPDFIDASVGFGIFVTAALHIPVIVLNYNLVKNPIVVKYTELPTYGEAEEAPAEEAVAAE